MRISIVSPVPFADRLGNATTARRWRDLLRGLGHDVDEALDWDGEPCDLLLALHARKSHGAIARFAAARPRRPLVVALTGTDLYVDLPDDPQALESLRLADRLVVLQPAGLDALPPQHRAKARVILQSAVAPERVPRKDPDGFVACVLAALREVKDPLLPARAAALLPGASRVRVRHAGKPVEPALLAAAEREAEANDRYEWLGELEPERARELLATSHVLCLPSRAEGGANVISEAVVADVPVLASRIPGTVGLLGPEHPGYPPVGDAEALAALLARAECDPGFVEALLASGARLRAALAPERERGSWADLLAEIRAEP
ncbi:MAG: selenoneine biosynthesis selenosugar synthase SenB [Planctomycetota bacterium]